MTLNLIYFLAVFFIGIIGGHFVNLIIRRFPIKLKQHLEELEEIKKGYPQDKLYPDIIKEDYSLSYVGGNAPYFLIITLVTSILEAFIYYVSKSNVSSFSYFLFLLAFLMVLRLPLLVELFVKSNRYTQSNSVNKMRPSGIMYRAYIIRTRPILCSVAMIPLLIVLVI